MIIITDNQELIVKLDHNPSGSPPNECHYYISYRDTTDSTYSFLNVSGKTNGTDNVSMIAGNASYGPGDEKVIDEISIFNPDGFSPGVFVTIIFYDGTTEYTLVKQEVNENQTLTYNDKWGWGKT